MKNLGKMSVLILAVTLILSLASAPAPVTAGVTPPSLEIDPQPAITATVSTQFTIQIWIRNIPEGNKLYGFDFTVKWDPTQMELVDYQSFRPPGKTWIMGWQVEQDNYWQKGLSTQKSEATDLEMAWASLTFHCLAEGSSKITLSTGTGNDNTVVLYDGESTFDTFPDPFEITCNQVEPSPVGGLVMPTNTLAILAPYLALAGLAVAVSAVVVVRKRR